MRQVILTVGPMCSGKTTCCKELLELDPELVLVSRDDICREKFGGIWLSAGQHDRAWDVVWDKLEELLRQENVRILLDAWNSGPKARSGMVSALKQMGADKVTAWYFNTPEDTCVEWFIHRESDERAVEYRSRYRNFHSHPVTLDQGFDRIITTDAELCSSEDLVIISTILKL